MFQINDIIWYIEFVDPYSYILQRNDGTYSVGCCSNFNKTIYLNQNLNGDFLKKVLTHEISHAALFSYNITLPLSIEEKIADLIATYGYEIIYLSDKIYREIEKSQYQDF